MFVEDGTGQARCAPVEHRTRAHHRAGQRDALVEVHPLEEHRHRESRGLAFGHRAGSQPGDEALDLGGAERLAVAFAADDFLRQHQARAGSDARTKARSNRLNLAEPSAATSLVSAWVGSPPARPAPKFVTSDTARQRNPCRRARMTSGTVDMPTRSAPRIFAARTSAGVSTLGPENHI